MGVFSRGATASGAAGCVSRQTSDLRSPRTEGPRRAHQKFFRRAIATRPSATRSKGGCSQQVDARNSNKFVRTASYCSRRSATLFHPHSLQVGATGMSRRAALVAAAVLVLAATAASTVAAQGTFFAGVQDSGEEHPLASYPNGKTLHWEGRVKTAGTCERAPHPLLSKASAAVLCECCPAGLGPTSCCRPPFRRPATQAHSWQGWETAR